MVKYFLGNLDLGNVVYRHGQYGSAHLVYRIGIYICMYISVDVLGSSVKACHLDFLIRTRLLMPN